MKAVGYARSLPIEDPAALEDIDIPEPQIGPRDLLVRVAAISVNPVDVKVRVRMQPETGHKLLGYDAAGTVEAVGAEVTLFQPGDEVYYAGDIGRPGTNAELHAVDERIVAKKPKSLDMAAAAALPLTAITAWELLFDCFDLAEGGGAGESLLVIGGAGGVGSILVQLAKALTGLQVIATASRPETQAWCREMGADLIIDHRQPIDAQLAALGIAPRYIAALTATDQHFDAIIEAIAPRGEIGLIDDPASLDITKIKPKALSFHWEFMFARSMFQASDMIAQHQLLARVAELVDAGRVKTTLQRNLGPASAATLRDAHRLQESGSAVGKTVLTGVGG
ncbi:MAG: zinc-binding alcohol dehydrogenase family protein [Pseudomonadota bacterium]